MNTAGELLRKRYLPARKVELDMYFLITSVLTDGKLTIQASWLCQNCASFLTGFVDLTRLASAIETHKCSSRIVVIKGAR